MNSLPRWFSRAVLVSAALSLSAPLRAHCDTLDGPVIAAAREALQRGDVAPVLMWIQPADEPAIRDAFTQAQAVRRLSADAAALADRYFFETLVRVHRAGEGAPFTGLKEGAPAEPGVVAADAALATGRWDDLQAATLAPLAKALKERFDVVRERKAHASHSVEAGRAYVAAYVDYVHFAEKVAALAAPAEPHAGPAPARHAH